MRHRIIALVTGLIGLGAIIPFSDRRHLTRIWCDLPEANWGRADLPLEEAATACGIELETVKERRQLYGGVFSSETSGTTRSGPAAEILAALGADRVEGLGAGQAEVCLRVLAAAAEMEMSVMRSPDLADHWRVTCALER